MYRSYNYKLPLLLAAILVSFSCTTDNPTIIQLPDKTPPSGYIVSPLEGSSDSGSTTLQVIAIDNEEVDTVFIMIKAQSAERYQSIDSTSKESGDIWNGECDTQESPWNETEN